jgi:hypothetical protein
VPSANVTTDQCSPLALILMLPLLLAQPVFDFIVRDALAGLAADDDGNLAGRWIDLDALSARAFGGAHRARKLALAEAIGSARGARRDCSILRHVSRTRTSCVNCVIRGKKKVIFLTVLKICSLMYTDVR